MKCSSCGTETNAKVCENCGSEIESTGTNNTVYEMPSTPIAPAPKNSVFKKWWFWVIIGVVAFGLISNAAKVNNSNDTSGNSNTKQKQGVTENKESAKPAKATQKDDVKQPEQKTPAPVLSDKVEWKQFLKEYEEWVNSYVALVKKYKGNMSDTTLLLEYTKSLQKLAAWSEKADKMETRLDNNPSALREYLAMLARVTKKLSTVY